MEESSEAARSRNIHDYERGKERNKGLQLFWQQFCALMKKNFLLSWRNKPATFMQLASSFFFVFLIFCCDKAWNMSYFSGSSFVDETDPQYKVVGGILPCEEGYFIKSPCFDFIWTGNTSSSAINSIVTSIMARNPGRPIPSSKVRGFETPEEADEWLYSNPMRCTGGLYFMERGNSVISYGLQTNSTSKQWRGYTEDPTLKFQIPLQAAAEREIARYLLQDSSLEWILGLKEFPHPTSDSFSSVGSIGPTFFLAAAMFGFVIQLGSVVSEKELKLRQAMIVMGLFDSAHWLSWLAWEGFLTLISAVFITLFGMLFQFSFFLKNSYLILFLTFFLFQINMVAFAFFLSPFISKSSSATTVGFIVYIIGFVTQLVTSYFPYSNTFSKTYRIIWSLFPPNLFAEALSILGDATSTDSDEGISWSQRSNCPSDDSDCVITMDDIFRWLSATFFVWFVLAIYLDNVIPDVNGVRKSFIYFLKPSYWTGKSTNLGGGACCCNNTALPSSDGNPNDEDVAAEELLVKMQVDERNRDPVVAIQVCGLVKSFPGSRKISCCCKCRKTPPHHAVKGIWLNIEKNKLFCLLGHNGAGKTTTINCLTGVLPITAGDALIYGHSIKDRSGRLNIQNLMGICPQFDILWGTLSAEEHIHLFASIKGLPTSSIKLDAHNLLSQVKLSDVAHLQARTYSGGMKRRLSVAIALIGDPKLVFLDEPTTGMDPVMRRHVWDVIQHTKKDRAIVLTTHSMEEADILSDRIAIMARGKLQCIGSSVHLKSRFGKGFVVTVCVKKEKVYHNSKNVNSEIEGGDEIENENNQVKQFFRERLNIEAKEEHNGRIIFNIPREKEELLKDFFSELSDKEEELGITDIALSLATLEEVFLNITRKVELENAECEGRFSMLTLPSGVTVKVPVGSQFAKIPGTSSTEHPQGLRVEVYWSIDENGSLSISGHSDEMPIPANEQMQGL